MRWIKVLIISWISISASQTFSQDHSAVRGSHGNQEQHKNDIAAFLGTTYILESGFILPTIGIEYVRKLNPYFGIGLLSEFEIGSHIIAVDELSNEEQEINRESAVLILPSVYFMYHNFGASIGYGVELEKKENLAMLKMGILYTFEFKNDMWIFVPNVSWDHTIRFDSIVYGFSIARRF